MNSLGTFLLGGEATEAETAQGECDKVAGWYINLTCMESFRMGEILVWICFVGYFRAAPAVYRGS